LSPQHHFCASSPMSLQQYLGNGFFPTKEGKAKNPR